jgi:hypothetical protein
MNRITRSPEGEGATTGGPDAQGQGAWGVISDCGLRDKRLREARNCPSLRKDQRYRPMPTMFRSEAGGNRLGGRFGRCPP